MRPPPSAPLAAAVLAYLTAMVLVITLALFRFESAPVHGLTDVLSLRDAVLNVVLFVPLGFVRELGRPRGGPADWRGALVRGAAVSAAIELAQVFLPERYPSLSDLVTNAAGAALGALLAARATRHVAGAPTVRALALDLPLIGLVYLLVPLLWLTGLSARPGMPALMLLPTAAAAWIVASVHSAYGAPAEAHARPLLQPALGAALFVSVTFLPVAPVDPWLVAWGAAVFAGIAGLRAVAPRAWTHERTPDGGRSRRFEGPTLRTALVPLVASVILAVVCAGGAQGSGWRGTLALMPPGAVPFERDIFAVMAGISGFTALGYATAELLGRRHERLRSLAPRAAAGALALAVPLEAWRGTRADGTASALALALSVAGAVFGAWLYVLQLRQVQALLGRRPHR